MAVEVIERGVPLGTAAEIVGGPDRITVTPHAWTRPAYWTNPNVNSRRPSWHVPARTYTHYHVERNGAFVSTYADYSAALARALRLAQETPSARSTD